MPGYKTLPEQFDGPAAAQVRFAEVLQRAGANDDAAQLLESALEVCVATTPELPGWLCGRLASIYRTLKRHDDEVRLLMRYRDSQTSEEARARFDARLSKAHAIAARSSRSETRMLASVRTAVNRKSGAAMAVTAMSGDQLGFGSDALGALRDGFTAAATSGDEVGLASALLRLRRDAKTNDYPPEQLVAAVKLAWRAAAPRAEDDAEAWNALYRDALTRSLALYFDEDEPQ
ncbi:MAG: hypothetical protein ABI601_00865 [bacterium]